MDGTLKSINTKLPYNAEIFIKSKFIKSKVIYLEKTETGYDVELDNEISITFDENGNWTSINSSQKLPDNIIPNAVKEKINKLKRFEPEYKNKDIHINEIRKIINSYRILIDHYLEMHIYSNS
ncbi:PepSY-like domain-containing protein [uncultured Brachyspira sp.]|uniref:PepSY-like domain-containing protein n=1 Tax=uncultured Brachyspira sp. TaxID=221953 RepID=UPI00261DF4FC|nr:PepSY-like domain-containing protein [uncultured Brachyspira sp.]